MGWLLISMLIFLLLLIDQSYCLLDLIQIVKLHEKIFKIFIQFLFFNLFVYLFTSGIMKPGLNAIMGPTGSGKSS